MRWIMLAMATVGIIGWTILIFEDLDQEPEPPEVKIVHKPLPPGSVVLSQEKYSQMIQVLTQVEYLCDRDFGDMNWQEREKASLYFCHRYVKRTEACALCRMHQLHQNYFTE